MEAPILNSSKALQFHKEYIEIKNDLICLKDSCFRTLRRLYDIKLPKNFFIQDKDKENNNKNNNNNNNNNNNTNNTNNNNNILELKENNLINQNEVGKSCQENENNSSINNEINVSDII